MAEFAFPRELRLLTPDQFRYVFEQPQRVSTPTLTLLGRRNSLSSPRLGLAIAKKQLRRAHDRNRIKRLAREVFRLHQHSLPPVDFVLIARKGVIELENQAIIAALEKLWRRHCRLPYGC